MDILWQVMGVKRKVVDGEYFMTVGAEDKLQVSIFLKSHRLAVIATNATLDQSPESALIAFVEDDDLSLYFQTSRYSRKANNLMLRQAISLVIGLDLEEMATLQYEGTAQQLDAEDEIEACKALFLAKKSPTTPAYLERPDTILFRVSPTWIRYSHYPEGAKHGHMIEIEF
jgi:general stress protein 26